MFVLVHNNHVILGPMPWRKFFFENVIKDDLDADIVLPMKNDERTPFEFGYLNLRILPVVHLPMAQPIKPKFQVADGPYWNFKDFHAEEYYLPKLKSLEQIRGELKSIVTDNRWKLEVGGAKVTIRDIEYTADTERESRSTYLQALQLGADNARWKFPEGFITLSLAELGLVVQSVMMHVQASFDWESAKHAEIDAAATVAELNEIVLEY